MDGVRVRTGQLTVDLLKKDIRHTHVCARTHAQIRSTHGGRCGARCKRQAQRFLLSGIKLSTVYIHLFLSVIKM